MRALSQSLAFGSATIPTCKGEEKGCSATINPLSNASKPQEIKERFHHFFFPDLDLDVLIYTSS